SHGQAHVWPTRWIAISGTDWCAASAQLVNSLERLHPVLTSAASTLESMKRRSAPADWAAHCPVRTPDKSKFTLASSGSEWWHCCFCTHGWLDHGDYFDSADWRR